MRNNKIKKVLLIILCSLAVIGIFACSVEDENVKYVEYKNFYEKVEEGSIESVLIEDQDVKFKIKNEGQEYYTENPEYEGFKEKLLLNGIKIEENSGEETLTFIFDLFFYLIYFGVIIFAIVKFLKINKETFKVVKHTKVKFSDIAGMNDLKKEMMKIVDILKNTKEYEKKGIRQTKGIILEGAPGNGKTLFAKALAEEANINFIATKGADFQSAMMSVGSKKIKTLFKKAKKYRPCIIFIDEFDAIGERRYYAGTGVDKENNRIVTALLNEMDGFESSEGIMVIAATNSYASLDPALIRPGRFDLKFNIGNPDLETRMQLIDLYTKNKKLDESIDKNKLAKIFENLSCSAIETVLNEASMLAILENKEKISAENIINAAKKTNCILKKY